MQAWHHLVGPCTSAKIYLDCDLALTKFYFTNLLYTQDLQSKRKGENG